MSVSGPPQSASSSVGHLFARRLPGEQGHDLDVTEHALQEWELDLDGVLLPVSLGEHARGGDPLEALLGPRLCDGKQPRVGFGMRPPPISATPSTGTRWVGPTSTTRLMVSAPRRDARVGDGGGRP